MSTDQLRRKKRLALIAHDNKKEDLIEWAFENKDALSHHELSGTGSTATLIEKQTGLSVEKLLSGPLGGDQQVGALIAEREIDFLIFFWDPMEAQPHDSDVKALLRIAVAWNILIANNRTTADFLLASTLMNQDYTMQVPDYSKY
ncbi:MAG TPA: methylglyoxal synthase [Flavisolibacter sp.]|jgi:methylglyoxal synthase|nr:methylglyoxal synthase [Flavisolibacter sp.]